MKRLNFTLKQETVDLLDKIAGKYFDGNKSKTVRIALESLANSLNNPGWVVTGYSPVELNQKANCHMCGTGFSKGRVLYRPVFEKGTGPEAIPQIPAEIWLDCPDCLDA